MDNSEMNTLIGKIYNAIEQMIPSYMEVQEDKQIANGNVAVCMIDEDGFVYGKMFGNNKPRLRQSYRVAWTKASQVWLTGVRTGEYEKMVFNGEVGENANGIEAPDLIGWQGGQPLTMKNGKTLSVGFSGFRGTTDLEIMVRALEMAE
jgi:glc operon protein GlcG